VVSGWKIRPRLQRRPTPPGEQIVQDTTHLRRNCDHQSASAIEDSMDRGGRSQLVLWRHLPKTQLRHIRHMAATGTEGCTNLTGVPLRRATGRQAESCRVDQVLCVSTIASPSDVETPTRRCSSFNSWGRAAYADLGSIRLLDFPRLIRQHAGLGIFLSFCLSIALVSCYQQLYAESMIS